MATIIIVDDEESLLELLELVLEDQGHQVFLASNGRKALDLIERQHPQLVISDVMMPVMDGRELLRRIRSKPEWDDIKVALISAAPIKVESAYRADKYINKPYDIEVIEAVVKELVESKA